jgi:hypothetical protein
MKRLLAVFLALPVAAIAHHGWSEYDSTKPLKLTGKILESGYEHPHGFVRLDTTGSDAKAGKTWHVVLAPPSRMEARGLAKDKLAKGRSATVEGYANRGKPEELRAERIIVDGKTIELR